jgi:hypothetical protein
MEFWREADVGKFGTFSLFGFLNCGIDHCKVLVSNIAIDSLGD